MAARIVLISAICLSLLGFSHARPKMLLPHFYVEGKVYCDRCHFRTPNRLSTPIEGAKVRLNCYDRTGYQVIYSVEAETKTNGTYRLRAKGEHDAELCEVTLVSSPNPECNTQIKSELFRESSQITLSTDDGIASDVRTANPLGFLASKTPSDECHKVLKELGLE